MSRDDNKIEHESYGVAVVSRRQGGDRALFQSAVPHQNKIALSIHHAYVRRDLSTDWVHHDLTPYVEVVMSEAQWARLVASIGDGGGTPVTITRAMTEGARDMAPPPRDVGRGGTREQFTGELETAVNERMEMAREAEARIKAMRERKKAPTKGELQELQKLIGSIAHGMGNTASFVLGQFEEAIEKNVESVKTEVEAHVSETLRRAGQDALSAEAYAARNAALIEHKFGDENSRKDDEDE